MEIALIAAKSKNNVIGKNNKLLWNLPDDLEFFMGKTKGHFLLMGRRTFESLEDDLAGRKVIVVTKIKNYHPSFNCLIFDNLPDGINEARIRNETELLICGGDSVYRQTIAFADKMYLTEIDQEFSGDAFFPEFDRTLWNISLIKEFRKDELHPIAFEISEFRRKLIHV